MDVNQRQKYKQPSTKTAQQHNDGQDEKEANFTLQGRELDDEWNSLLLVFPVLSAHYGTWPEEQGASDHISFHSNKHRLANCSYN